MKVFEDIEVIASDKSVISPQELDIYIPSKNLAIEFNGLYWHTETRLGEDYHYNKWKACKDKGIQLITVWEDEWLYRQDTVKHMLKHKLGRADKTIGARKCSLVDISYYQASEFLDQYHIQGSARASKYVGLVYQDELVAVMTIHGKTLNRYATKYTIPGGFTRLLKYSNTKELITFADLSVSNGGLYANNGWSEDGFIKPDYRYLVDGRREHKFNYRKKRFESDPNLLFDPNMTERQLAEFNGLPRIYDCGKLRYTINL